MNDFCLLTPPPHLMLRWQKEARDEVRDTANHFDMQSIQMIKAARWGADQELEACCNFLKDNELCDPFFYKHFRAARRPQPPSLKEQALAAHDRALFGKPGDRDTIRRALEQLPD